MHTAPGLHIFAWEGELRHFVRISTNPINAFICYTVYFILASETLHMYQRFQHYMHMYVNCVTEASLVSFTILTEFQLYKTSFYTIDKIAYKVYFDLVINYQFTVNVIAGHSVSWCGGCGKYKLCCIEFVMCKYYYNRWAHQRRWRLTTMRQ